MGQQSPRDRIRVRGARQNNLKGFDLDLPARRLIVVTGLSGSGKSSLAFDTLYAEGQRRYIETFSPYARQFFDRMDKPRVDAIEGIPPAIALEQRNSVRTTRSTVGTLTEICDHLKLLWPHLARLHCRQCAQPVLRESPSEIWNVARRLPHPEFLVSFLLPLSQKLTLPEQLALVGRQGFHRLLIDGEVVRLDDAPTRLLAAPPPALTVVQDRLRPDSARRSRFVEACEQAYHFGHGKLALLAQDPDSPSPARWTLRFPFSRHLHCAACDLDYRDPSPALFSFNHPIGACPTCKGFGRIIAIDYDLAIPDPSRTLADGAVKPWQSGVSAECQRDLVRAARSEGVPLTVPFAELSPAHQRWVIEGDPGHGPDNPWPHAWYGVKGYFRWLESKAYKMHVRVLLARYRAYRPCPDCNGQRFQPDALLWRLTCPDPPSSPPGSTPDSSPSSPVSTSLTLADFYALPAERALHLIDSLAPTPRAHPADPLAFALAQVQSRLAFLVEVGLGYLTLDRPTRTLSGGETQRVNLTTCLGSQLVHTLFVLDEPSVGLHPRDTDRLTRILTRLRGLGNTVVVVEHEESIMRAADHLVDLGPGHGEAGGHLVAQGPFDAILSHPDSITGAYLSGRRRIPIPERRPIHGLEPRPAPTPSLLDPSPSSITPPNPSPLPRPGRRRPSVPAALPALALADAPAPYPAHPARVPSPMPALLLTGITRHNLRQLEVAIPLQRLVCLSGVSGSGKSTLVGELLRLLRQTLGNAATKDALDPREAEHEPPGDRPTGQDDDPDLEEIAAAATGARLAGTRHLGAVALVDQSPIGRTPRSNPAVYCGAFEPIRELFARSAAAREAGLGASAFSFNSRLGQCEQCRGAGFERIEMQFLSDVFIRCPACEGRRYRPHILDICIHPPAHDPLSIADLLDRTVDDATAILEPWDATHARYATERLRLVRQVGLGYLRLGQPINTLSGGESQRLKLAGHLAESLPGVQSTLFIFDEPTTGLHFEDIRILLDAFQSLVAAGHSVLIVEHNLEVLKCADWLIDLGPEGGSGGGRIVAAGTPEHVAHCPESHTGQSLRAILPAL
ncbi:MAG: excinuclease ABC subunit UvrA [Verrucomicrobiae bacterium]|nr:excinuclease ABC subunit UvrA [Verrucomicrobiae bacterium]